MQHVYVAGQVENQYQKCIRRTVQGVFAASMHPRTAVQVTIQVIQGIHCFHVAFHAIFDMCDAGRT